MRCIVAAVVFGWLAHLSLALLAPAPAVSRYARRKPVRQIYREYDQETGMRKFGWNLNYSREPWGIAINAEVWNSRVAMVAFVWVVLQELIQGEGVITKFQKAQSIDEVYVPIAFAAVFFLGILAIAVRVALEPDDTISYEAGMEQISQVDDIVSAPRSKDEEY
mmetsp:Transcript_24625/g.79599  ORF Transcript_24625/g.79599 Transcript_24625/m.79599 type:complete len:164 (-) Transcript_24625:76-567(-)